MPLDLTNWGYTWEVNKIEWIIRSQGEKLISALSLNTFEGYDRLGTRYKVISENPIGMQVTWK